VLHHPERARAHLGPILPAAAGLVVAALAGAVVGVPIAIVAMGLVVAASVTVAVMAMHRGAIAAAVES
jgi:hypothetical protein